jgi:hypothetical protein
MSYPVIRLREIQGALESPSNPGQFNGSNLVWALGKFEPEDGKTKVRVRFVPEPIGTAGVVLIFVVVVVLFAAHSWVAWALLAFVILVLGTAFPVARSERDALARFLLGRLRS